VHIHNFKTCYFIKGKEAILVLFRQDVSFSRVPGPILIFFHTILYWSYIAIWTRVRHNMMHFCLIHKRAQYDNYIRYFDNVLICLKMSLVFLSLPQRQHKMHIFRKIKSANSLLMPIIYKPASEQLFWMMFISEIVYICSH